MPLCLSRSTDALEELAEGQETVVEGVGVGTKAVGPEGCSTR